MIKKATAYLFIFIATSILVAHAFVPHHHFPKQVFTITEHSDKDLNGNKHHTDEHNHTHNCGNDYDFCSLQQVITTPVNTSKQEFNPLTINFIFGKALAIIQTNDFACKPPPILWYRQTPFQNSFHTCFKNSVSGLRAPPSV